jgi:hypothetical protein
MPLLLACPNGHQWELPDGEKAKAAPPHRCPVCAAEVDAPVHVVKHVEDAETLPGRSGDENAPGSSAAIAAQPRADALPMLPGYEIQAELGRGGMGVVYRARHTQLDRLVAIKMLPAETGHDPHFLERFIREARALARLSHPAIVTVHDFGQAGDQTYFVMEFVAGTDLRQRLNSGRLPPAEVFRIVSQVCDALQYAHDEGIVHRDIKPENILLDERGRVKIADFGIAKLLTRSTGQYTLTGPWQLVGTWRYMAPEQLEDPQGLDHRADIYSLGVVFYEMLTGKMPQGQFPPPSQVAGVDSRVDDLVLRALQSEPQRRFAKVGEMKAALDDLAGAVPAGVPAARALSHPGAVRAEAATKITALAPEIPSGLRRRVIAASRGLLFCGILALLAPVPNTYIGVLLVPNWTIASVGPRLLFALTVICSIVSPAVGSMLILTSFSAARLRRYPSALQSSVLAMLPLSPLWIITFWVGIWSLEVFRDPKVRRAFVAQRSWNMAHPRAPGAIRRFLGQSTGWVVLGCIAGIILCVQPVLPWCELQVAGDNEVHTLAQAYGYQSPLGIIPAVVLLVYALLLTVAGFRERVALWEPIARMIVGMTVLLFAAGTIIGENNSSSFAVVSTSNFNQRVQGEMLGNRYSVPVRAEPNGVRFDVSSGVPTFLQISFMGQGDMSDRLRLRSQAVVYLLAALGLAILLLGTVQLRGVLLQPRNTSGEPGATATGA